MTCLNICLWYFCYPSWLLKGSYLSDMVPMRQMGKWESYGWLQLLNPSPTITSHVLQLHPSHVVPLPPCSLRICLMSFFPCFGKVVLSLIPVVASVCNGLHPLPPLFSLLSSGIISRSGQLAPAPVQVKCFVICLPWEHDFPSDCSQHLTVLLGCGWKYPESRDCPFLCVSVFAVPVPDKVSCTIEAGCEGVLSSHCLCPSASIMPLFCISFWSAFYFFCP